MKAPLLDRIRGRASAHRAKAGGSHLFDAELLEEVANALDITALVGRFLAWPLPKSVRSDLCVTMDYPHPRSGTNLLTADEARQMLDHLLTVDVGRPVPHHGSGP